jgi:hypothetical protein
MIYQRLGEPAKAKDFLQRAMDINAHFHVFHAEKAAQMLRAYASGDKQYGRDH